MKNSIKNGLVIELSEDQALYLFQILQQERIKIESLNGRQVSPDVEKYQLVLNSLIKAIPCS
jgi:hypothetical protein